MFVAKLNATASALVYATYLGGNQWENSGGITLDGTGNAYVVGDTPSLNFPTTSGAYQTTIGGSVDTFVTKLNTTGSARVYSTFLGEVAGILASVSRWTVPGIRMSRALPVGASRSLQVWYKAPLAEATMCL